MATAKKKSAPASAPVKKAAPKAKAPARAPAKAPAKVAAKVAAKTPATRAKAAPAALKPIKETFSKTALQAHLAATSGVEPKAVKAVLAALESTITASVHRRGAGSFTLPGLLKINAIAVPATKARKGINPFTKEPTVFKAKPASVKLKVRPLKKLKDAAV